MKIAIKRVYEPYEESDGYRVLVDPAVAPRPHQGPGALR